MHPVEEVVSLLHLLPDPLSAAPVIGQDGIKENLLLHTALSSPSTRREVLPVHTANH